MTATRRQALLTAPRPELVVAGVVAAAWLALLLHEAWLPHTHATTPSSSLFGDATRRLSGNIAGWVVMSVAMMGPVALPAVRHVASSSLRWRRRRAVAEFAAVYTAIWVAFGAIALAAVSPVRPSVGLVALALGVAAVWQLTPLKRRFLRQCHRAVPLPPTGVRATAGCVRFGRVHGLACVGSCGTLMLVMAVVPSRHVIWSAALTPLVLWERFARKPRRAARQAAMVLAGAAVSTAVIAL